MILMGACGGVGFQVVVVCCVSSFTFFFVLWPRVSECDVSRFEFCLAHFF